MNKRFSSPERRIQIIQAAFELLAHVSVEGLTTRQVAQAVGVSQPALFRHFANREAILQGVMELVQSSLEESARQVLAKDLDARQTLVQLLGAFLGFIAEHPGAPRMLFYDAASMGEQPSELRGSLRQIVERQMRLVGGLVLGEIERGGLPAQLDAVRAAEIFVGLLQGEALRWHLGGQLPGGLSSAEDLVDFWWAALSAGQPAKSDQVPVNSKAKSSLLLLDARPLLKAGQDPFEAVHAALDELSPHGMLILVAPFRPDPLIAVLGKRGLTVQCMGEDPGPFSLLISSPGAPSIMDLLDLPTPEPLEEVLLGVEKLGHGEALLAHLPRPPRLLFPRLEERGFLWTCVEMASGQAMLHVQRSTQ